MITLSTVRRRAALLAILSVMIIAVAGCQAKRPTTKHTSNQGRQLWWRAANAPLYIQQLITDEHDNIYLGGSQTMGKYDSAGRVLSTKTPAGGRFWLDKVGNVYSETRDSGGAVFQKHSPDGLLMWEIKEPGLGGTSWVDADGNTYMNGMRSNPKPPFEQLDTKFTKLDSGGKPLWTVLTPPMSWLNTTVDDGGSLYLAYHPMVGSQPQDETLVAKYSKDGSREWIIKEATPYSMVFVNPHDGFVYFIGGVGRTARAMNVTAYDPSGRKAWSKRVHGPSESQAVTGDSGGNIYVTGPSGDNLRVTKISSDAVERWTRDYELKGTGAMFVNHTNGMVVDERGDINIAATYGTVTSEDGRRYRFGVVKIAPDGRLRWQASDGPYDLAESESGIIPVLIATDKDGNIIISPGTFIAKFGPPK